MKSVQLLTCVVCCSGQVELKNGMALPCTMKDLSFKEIFQLHSNAEVAALWDTRYIKSIAKYCGLFVVPASDGSSHAILAMQLVPLLVNE